MYCFIKVEFWVNFTIHITTLYTALRGATTLQYTTLYTSLRGATTLHYTTLYTSLRGATTLYNTTLCTYRTHTTHHWHSRLYTKRWRHTQHSSTHTLMIKNIYWISNTLNNSDHKILDTDVPTLTLHSIFNTSQERNMGQQTHSHTNYKRESMIHY